MGPVVYSCDYILIIRTQETLDNISQTNHVFTWGFGVLGFWGFGVGSLCLFSVIRVQTMMIPRHANCVI